MSVWLAADTGVKVVHRKQSKRQIGAVMVKARKSLWNLLADENGGEVLEYALIMGLIVVAAIAAVGAVGAKVLDRWNSANSSM